MYVIWVAASQAPVSFATLWYNIGLEPAFIALPGEGSKKQSQPHAVELYWSET